MRLLYALRTTNLASKGFKMLVNISKTATSVLSIQKCCKYYGFENLGSIFEPKALQHRPYPAISAHLFCATVYAQAGKSPNVE